MTSVGTCSLFNFALVSATENHKEELHDQSMEVFNESHCSDDSDKGVTDDLVVHVQSPSDTSQDSQMHG